MDYAEIFYRGKTPSRTCLFCVPNPGMTLWETDNFRCIADTYPILPGHVMISSKEHYGSAGELPTSLHAEFLECKNISKEYADLYGHGCIFYEHGKAGACHASAQEDIHCEHFHLHCLPKSACIHKEIQKQFNGIPLQRYEELFIHYSKHGPYLFFENDREEKIFYPAQSGRVPSHFLRTLLCQTFGISTLSDWSAYNDLEKYKESRALIKQIMHRAQLPRQGEKMYALL